jgi:hypothetical protein
MRKALLMSTCVAVIGLSAAASAQTAGAPANGQTNVTGPATTGKGSMSAMNKMKKKPKNKKDTTSDDGAMEKGMERSSPRRRSPYARAGAIEPALLGGILGVLAEPDRPGTVAQGPQTWRRCNTC